LTCIVLSIILHIVFQGSRHSVFSKVISITNNRFFCTFEYAKEFT